MKGRPRWIVALLFFAAGASTFLPWTKFPLFSLSLWDYVRYSNAFQVEMYGRMHLVSPFGLLYLFGLLPVVSAAGAVMALRSRDGMLMRVTIFLPLVLALSFIGAYIGVNSPTLFVHTIDSGMVTGAVAGAGLAIAGMRAWRTK